MRLRWCGLLAALLPPALHALPDYHATLSSAEAAAAACSKLQTACRADAAPPDLLPPPGSGDEPTLRLDWLRAALAQAQKAPADVRGRDMQQARDRLDQSIAALDAKPADDTAARAAAAAILNQRQFRFARQTPGWWQLLKARFWRWLSRLLEGTVDAAEHRPWLGTTIEWLCLAGALAGILAYLLRLARRDRLRVEIPWRGQARQGTQEAGPDWATLAAEAARSGAWRDAVHALYWSAIAKLTAAGRWPHGEIRTPREYLRLLGADSPERPPLTGLTALLERLWYAGRPASETDYRQARDQARALGVEESR